MNPTPRKNSARAAAKRPQGGAVQRAVSKQRAWQIRRMWAGLCAQCGRAPARMLHFLHGQSRRGVHCEDCAARQRERSLSYWRANHPVPTKAAD